jgi:hypothetical protein
MSPNPLDERVIGRCAGCDGDIYDGEEFRYITLLPGTRKKIHEDFSCFKLVLDAKTPEEEAEHPRPVKFVSVDIYGNNGTRSYFKSEDPEMDEILRDCLPEIR